MSEPGDRVGAVLSDTETEVVNVDIEDTQKECSEECPECGVKVGDKAPNWPFCSEEHERATIERDRAEMGG